MNLPNKLTVFQNDYGSVFCIVYADRYAEVHANKWIALVIFCVASLTDMLDGKIARASIIW